MWLQVALVGTGLYLLFGRRRGEDDTDYLTFPLPPGTWRVTSPSGLRTSPMTDGSACHLGIDLGAAMGTPVYAVNDGVVTLSRSSASAGLWIKLAHSDGLASEYMHLSVRSVEVGDRVRAGQQIGKVGSTGHSTGPHLHFGMSMDGKRFDPSHWLDLESGIPCE